MLAENRHKDEYGESPQVVSMVPGVVTIAGEFSMFCRGYALCAASDRSLYIEVSRRQDSNVRIYNSVANDRKRFGLSGIKYRKEDRWGSYVKGMLLAMQDVLEVPGLNITLSGDMLNCDGRMQAAAIGVGVGMALYGLAGLEPDRGTIASCCWKSCSKFCGELFNLHMILAMLYARKGGFLLFDMQDLSFEHIDDPFNGAGEMLALVNAGMPPLAMREELYSKHSQSKDAMQVLEKVHPGTDYKVFPYDDLKDRQIPLDEETRTICRYVYDESRIALALARSIGQRDFVQSGKLLSKLGEGLRDRLELTCPELDWLSRRSLETGGCLGNSVVDNGGGGCIATFMERSSFDAFVSKLDEYERIFGFVVQTSPFVPCQGACIIGP